MSEQESRWKVDRHIPVALILTLIGSMLSGAYYFATLTSNHETRIKNLEEAIPEVRSLSKDVIEIKTHLPYIKDILNSMSNKIDRNAENTTNVARFLKDRVEWVDQKDQ